MFLLLSYPQRLLCSEIVAYRIFILIVILRSSAIRSFIKTQDNELIIHPLVSDPIKEGSGLFGKETLDSRELKMFAQTSRIISKV